MKKNCVFLFLFLFCSLSTLFAQQSELDSLLEIVEVTQNDTNKVKIYANLCWLLRNTNTINALKYGNLGLALAHTLSYEKGEADIWNKMGVVYRNVGEHSKSLECYDQALKLAEKVKDSTQIAYAYNNIGTIYGFQENYQMALDYNIKAIHIFEQLKNYKGLGFALLSASNTCVNLKKLPQALDYAIQSFKFRQQAKQQLDAVISLRLIAYIHYLQKDYRKAKIVSGQAIKIYEENKLTSGYFVYSYLAKTYLKEKNLDSALYFAKKGYNAARNIIKIGAMEEESLILSEVYAARKEYQESYKYLLESYQSKDSLYKKENAKEIAHHALVQKQQELEILAKDQKIREEELVIQTMRQYWLLVLVFFSLLVTIIIILLVWQSNRRIKKAYTEIQQQKFEIQTQAKDLSQVNKTKDKLFSILGHDLRSPIIGVKGVLDLMATNDISEEELQIIIPELQRNVSRVTETLENLLQWSASQMKGITTSRTIINPYYLTELNMELFMEIAKNKQITLRNEIPKNVKVYADENQVRLILRNLLNNAIKFTKKNGTITVKSIQKEKFTQIIVEDTGVGMSTETVEKLFQNTTSFTSYGTEGEKGTGLGLLLCKEMVEINGGKIWVESQIGKGSSFFFTLQNI
jgi:signal transduction histidine kinase